MMRKTLLFICIILAYYLTLQSQDVYAKKCKSCGKALKECQYKGHHTSKTSSATMDYIVMSKVVNKLIQVADKDETGFWIGTFPGFEAYIDVEDGSMYYGEFDAEGIPNGIITSVLFDSKKIDDGEYWNSCKGTLFHVGYWKNGEVSGMGSCYDKNGCLIYHGLFADEKPAGKYPMTRNLNMRFEAIEYSNGDMYIGQRKECLNGFGIYIWKNGSCLYAKWGDDGKPERDGVFITSSGDITDPPIILEFAADGR